MSFRYYPIYQKGNPQLRIFLPNFWMKLVKPTQPQPLNIVQFKVPTGMTDYDIRNYLEKIYKIPVIQIKSILENGKIKPVYKNGYLVKEDDFRRVYVTLPRDMKFEFPDFEREEINSKEENDRKEHIDGLKASYINYVKEGKGRFGLPNWYSF